MDACHSEDDKNEHRQMRRVAFFAIVVSTSAVIASIVTLPALYSYVQSFQSHLNTEADFCKTRSRDIWMEIRQINGAYRYKRQAADGTWLFGRFVARSDSGGYDNTPDVSSPYAPAPPPVINSEPAKVEACCPCQQGPTGPPGQTGDPGPVGKDGKPGKDGDNGKDGQILTTAILEEPCIICPPGPPGPRGQGGPKGPQGPRGMDGAKGTDGSKGETGMHGAGGAPGVRGKEGEPGPKGAPGRSIPVNGALGPPGPPGDVGLPGTLGPPGPNGIGEDGPQGPPGDDGKSGPPGAPGLQGQSGLPGEPGERGTCEHCPEPRTPPGYKK